MPSCTRDFSYVKGTFPRDAYVMQFEWQVATYRWVDTDGAPVSWIASASGQSPMSDSKRSPMLVAKDSERRSYKPFQKTTLYQIFADTAPTKEGILGFANEYGSLFGDTSSYWFDPEGACEAAELFGEWEHMILSMKQILELTGLIKARRGKELTKYFSWKGKEAIQGRNLYSYGLPFTANVIMAEKQPVSKDDAISTFSVFLPVLTPRLFKNFRSGVIGPAREYVRQALAWHMQREITVSPGWDKKQKNLELENDPRNLAGVLWLQVFEVFTGKNKPIECEVCGKVFVVAQTSVNKGRIICSDKCRQQQLRNRRKEAKQLHAKRKSISAIAKQLKTDKETVKGWISGGVR